MSEAEMIYRFLKKIITENTGISSCYFDDMDSKEVNSAGIYPSESQVDNDRRLSDGSHIKRISNTVIIYNCKRDKRGLLDGRAELEKLRDVLETKHNTVMYFKDNDVSDKSDYTQCLNVGQVDLLSGIVRLGKNEHEIPRFSIRLRINYTRGGN